MIKQGFEMDPKDKYQSINHSKFTNQNEMYRVMRPADVFEPGYDTTSFVKQDLTSKYKSQT